MLRYVLVLQQEFLSGKCSYIDQLSSVYSSDPFTSHSHHPDAHYDYLCVSLHFLQIKDAVPISHTIPSVPITEAAFVQIESFFTSSQPQPLQIVGCYGASNNAAIDDPTPFAQKILSKIAAQIPSAVLLQLCTKKFEELAMTVGTSSSSSTIELFNVIKNITPSERKYVVI